MLNFEVKNVQDSKFSLNCRELYQYINKDILNQHKRRITEKILDKKHFKSKSKSIYKHIPIPILSNSGPISITERKKSSSNYYSRIMNNFLSDKSPTKKNSKKEMKNLDEKDFWLLGDDIKFIE